MEEVGELSQQIIESTIFDHRLKEVYNFESMREEAVQVAAVALALVQCLDRNEDKYMKS
jgi:NTP pyrophosphatase (non-canonical NTP hydrolase)